LLSEDFRFMNSWIGNEIKKCYFERYCKNDKVVFNKVYRKRFLELNKKSALGNLVLYLSDDKKKQEYSEVKVEESNFFIHYKKCIACELNCPLAKQDFICNDSKGEEK